MSELGRELGRLLRESIESLKGNQTKRSDRMKTRKVWLECGDCGSKAVTLSKIVEYEDWEEAIIRETLLHDGFGWDLNTFEVKCARCGSKNIKVTWEKGD